MDELRMGSIDRVEHRTDAFSKLNTVLNIRCGGLWEDDVVDAEIVVQDDTVDGMGIYFVIETETKSPNKIDERGFVNLSLTPDQAITLAETLVRTVKSIREEGQTEALAEALLAVSDSIEERGENHEEL
jgi:hypothetical protein